MRISDWSSDVCSSDLRDNTTDIRDGGVVAAYRESLRGKHPNGTFSHIIIGDTDAASVDACAARLQEMGAKNVHKLYGASVDTVVQAISLDRKSTRLNSSH